MRERAVRHAHPGVDGATSVGQREHRVQVELGVYVLVAPEPDRQQPHEDDEVYVVLEGSGTLEVEDERVDLLEGQAVFVPAGADHRFVGYEQLAVLVVFERRTR